MRLREGHGLWRALACAALSATPACVLFEASPGRVVATDLRAVRVPLGAGVDQGTASARVADAARVYVVAAEGEPGHLRLRNRRLYEVRVRVDGATASLDLMSAGGTSPIRHITQDRQLAQEYREIVRIASRVLRAPEAPAPVLEGPKPKPRPGKR